MTRSSEFDDLGDAEKVKCCQTEIAETVSRLDDMIARLASLRTEVDDPNGLVRFTLGDDGRLLRLFIDDFVAASLTRLSLEKKLNNLFLAGNEAMRLSRKEFWTAWRNRASETVDDSVQVRIRTGVQSAEVLARHPLWRRVGEPPWS